ncbi:MAG: M23 family metallopeptidase [Bryobacteraceae bacterium]
MKIVAALVALLAIAAPAGLYLASSRTSIAFDPAPKVIGAETPVKVRLDNPHGVRHLTAVVVQNGQRYPLFETGEPASRLLFWRRKLPARHVEFSAGQKKAPALKEGKATLHVEARSNDLRASTDAITAEVEVILAPPRVVADGFQHYINQGGAELAVFTVSGYWTEAGVRVGRHTFPSYPLPGSTKQERLSLFAFSWDTPADAVPVVFARNPAGVEATARFWFKVFPKKFRKRDIELTDDFMDKVAGQIAPGASGGLLSRFLRINGELRRENNAALARLSAKTEPRFLWSGPFQQLSNSKVESAFADQRTYVYKGKKVDEQVHLGFDLSVTMHNPVTASNDGNVVHAADLGIYGNCVVIDHGFGLQSIYAHLSEIGVKEGEMVKKGRTIGKSGSTGLAGGDHLHFTMQIGGVQVNPVEWWDDHWIQDRIRSKVSW